MIIISMLRHSLMLLLNISNVLIFNIQIQFHEKLKAKKSYYLGLVLFLNLN